MTRDPDKIQSEIEHDLAMTKFEKDHPFFLGDVCKVPSAEDQGFPLWPFILGPAIIALVFTAVYVFTHYGEEIDKWMTFSS